MAIRPYSLRPLKLGCEVFGLDLSQEVKKDVVELVKKDVRAYGLLVFRDQGNITPDKHLEIGRWFGEIESTFYDHPKSPHRDIFRVSNDNAEGCRNVGRTGWHIDGSFQMQPFSHSLYHIISVPQEGTTSFAPLTEIIEGLGVERRKLWERLYMASNRRSGPVHPLIYNHPETNVPVLCFHLGMTEGFLLDAGTPAEKDTSPHQTQQILKQIEEEILKDPERLYHHKYRKGDFIISDNLALGHEASPETQLPKHQIGLRVMHRVTIAGKSRPKK